MVAFEDASLLEILGKLRGPEEWLGAVFLLADVSTATLPESGPSAKVRAMQRTSS